MNFEKRMKKRGNQKLNKFAKNPYHVPWFKRIPTWVKIATPTVLTTVAAALVVVIMMPSFMTNKSTAHMQDGRGNEQSNNNKPATNNDYKEDSNAGYHSPSNDGHAPEQATPWDSRSIGSKYSAFTYESMTFETETSVSTPINEQYINTKLGDVQVNGYDDVNKEAHQESASVYSIKNFSSEIFVALKVNGDDNYYPYYKTDTVFANIGDMLNKTTFVSETSVTNVTYRDYTDINNATVTFSGYEQSAIYNILFDDVTIAGYSTKDSNAPSYSSNKVFDIYINIPAIGNSADIKVVSNSCMIVKIGTIKEVFQLSETKFQTLSAYFETNATTL